MWPRVERCVYFRSRAGEPCFGGLREGVVPCDERVVGYLIVDPPDGKKPERHPLCADHFAMRRSNVVPGVSRVEAA